MKLLHWDVLRGKAPLDQCATISRHTLSSAQQESPKTAVPLPTTVALATRYTQNVKPSSDAFFAQFFCFCSEQLFTNTLIQSTTQRWRTTFQCRCNHNKSATGEKLNLNLSPKGLQNKTAECLYGQECWNMWMLKQINGSSLPRFFTPLKVVKPHCKISFV